MSGEDAAVRIGDDDSPFDEREGDAAEYALYDREKPALSGVERDLYDAVSAEEPWSLVDRFADIERVSGSAGEREAARELTARLDRLGVSYDRHDSELYLSIPESASLTLDGESKAGVKTVAFGGGEASGDVVAVDDPPEAGGGDIEALLSADLHDLGDVEGKVAVLGGILPIEAIEEVQAAGAAAVVVHHPHPKEPHEGIATPVWGGAPTPSSPVDAPDIPIVTVADPVGRELRANEGATVSVSAETTTGWMECPLVEAHIPGEGDPADDDFVLLHGHYDSWHVGVADNATGDGALLELARVFDDHCEDLKRDLRVCWWPGHSTGRYAGSTWYADEHALDIRERCVAEVNVDSPGAADATEFEDMLAWMGEADAVCRQAIADVCGKASTEVRPPRAGDYSFSNLGVTGAFMLSSNIPRAVRDERGYHAVGGCGGNADAWHVTTDTLDKADPEVLVRDIRVYAIAVARLLRETPVPLDFRHTVASHRETLAAYDDASEFDLSKVRDAAADLAEALDDFYAAVNSGRIADSEATDRLKRLSRELVAVNYTTEGTFEQDPAYDRPPYPGLAPVDALSDLDDDEAKFLKTELRRERTRAVDHLRRARRIAREPLAGER
ncbi:M28 family metallopeptidase [Halobaculum limi]|uniref:M28 family metallopeptidase n=1 Tax=Halobaculum limi TaxID=3031916 RepID=UPI00240727BA|nr:M28 family peptidase [Halobaculum sp. YSMS11]